MKCRATRGRLAKRHEAGTDVQWVEDGARGKSLDRLGLVYALYLLDGGEGIVFAQLDRLSRSSSTLPDANACRGRRPGTLSCSTSAWTCHPARPIHAPRHGRFC